MSSAGKWLVFLPADQVDAAWQRVRDATAAGELGISAKVSTAKPNPDARDDRYVIYVYTADWREEAEVMRVREALRALGVEDRIGYKRNLETFRGEYQQKGKTGYVLQRMTTRRAALRLALLVLRPEVLVSALAAGGRPHRVPGVAAHADLHIEEPLLSFGESCHSESPRGYESIIQRSRPT